MCQASASKTGRILTPTGRLSGTDLKARDGDILTPREKKDPGNVIHFRCLMMDMLPSMTSFMYMSRLGGLERNMK